MYDTIDDIEKLAGVKCAGSDREESALHDPSLTIFLTNGYRLISEKSMLGQSIELEAFNKAVDKSAPAFKAEIYHSLGGSYESPDNNIYQEQNGVQTKISLETFISEVHNIIGQEIFDFLKERHSSVPFRVVQGPKF